MMLFSLSCAAALLWFAGLVAFAAGRGDIARPAARAYVAGAVSLAAVSVMVGFWVDGAGGVPR